MNNDMKRVFLILFSVFSLTSVFAQRDSIGALLSNPEQYIKKVVNVKGKAKAIEKSDEDNSSTKFQIHESKDVFIKVKVLDTVPLKNKKYKVKGILYEDEDAYFIHADQLECTNCPKESKEDDIPFIYFILGGVIITIPIVISLVKSSKRKTQKRNSDFTSPTTPDAPPHYPQPQPNYSDPSSNQSFATISFNTSDIPKQQEPESAYSNEADTDSNVNSDNEEATVRFVKGKLKITDGPEKGKEVRIIGRSSSIGQIASIGRPSKTDNNSDYHIPLNDPTVSRRQAEIREHQGKVYLKNLSSTNPTVVKGVQMEVGQEMILEPGMNVSMGNVVLEYLLT